MFCNLFREQLNNTPTSTNETNVEKECTTTTTTIMMESTAANVSSLDKSYISLVSTCYYKIKCITCTCNYASQNDDSDDSDDVPSLPPPVRPTHFIQQ